MKLQEATVLVVEDEPDLREVLGEWLRRIGCRVVTAANGAEALDILKTQKIHIVLSDIRMPIMDGVELVRRVYEMKLVIPSIIFVSGFNDVAPRQMYGHGVEALFEKPMKPADLLRALERSVVEHDRRWLDPWSKPVDRSISIEMESLAEAMGSGRFELGRGGCCFEANTSLQEDETVDLQIQFLGEDRVLHAQVRVRWFDQATKCAGASFHYLYPECRDWVTAAIEGGKFRSFIPLCTPKHPST